MLEVKFNKNSSSSKIREALHLSSNFEQIEDGKYLYVLAPELNNQFLKLVSLVYRLKGTELNVNGQPIFDIFLWIMTKNCSKKGTCNGICKLRTEYLGTFRALGLISNDDPFDVYSGPGVFEDLQNPNIILSRAGEESITIDKDEYIDQYLKDHEMIARECDRFSQPRIKIALFHLPDAVTLHSEEGSPSNLTPKVVHRNDFVDFPDQFKNEILPEELRELKIEILLEMDKVINRVLNKYFKNK